MIKVSDYIIKYLEDYGITDIFMLPGGGCIHLVDSLGKSKINAICNLHEQGSGISAEAYAQYKNDIGVALVTTGPGSTNIITAISAAWCDSTPLVIICGQVQTKDRINDSGVRQMGFQEVDMVSMVKGITKYAITVTDSHLVPKFLSKAINIAKSGRPGPVLLEIPLDIQSQQIDENGYMHEYKDYTSNPFYDIDGIIQEINKAKRPVILAGNGIRLGNALPEFYEFITKTNIPVLTTWKALDFLEEEHPLFVGRPGSIASRGANFNQQNSDLIICIGARLDHGQIAYQKQYFAREAVKVICDIDMFELNKIKCDYEVCTSAKTFLTDLVKNIDKINIDTNVWLDYCKKLYNKYPVVLPEYHLQKNYVNVYSFIDKLSNVLPENSLLIPGSSGTCSEVVMQAFKTKKGTRVFNTEGLGPMGFGIPAAIGGCIASGRHTTICIDGDGGFFMNIQELEVVRRLNLPIIFFVLNNNGYGAIRTTQNNFFEGRLVTSDPSSGLTLPDIGLTAHSYKIPHMRISDNNVLDYILNDFDLDPEYGPLIVEIMMDPNHETLPKTASFKREDGTFFSKPMEDMKPFLPREEFLQNLLIKPIEE